MNARLRNFCSQGRSFAIVIAAVLGCSCVSYAQQATFDILRGAKLPVCRAYLSALRKVASDDKEFGSRPWCGGDFNPSVEGFPLLRRNYVTDVDEAFALKSRISGFLRGIDQLYAENHLAIKDRESERYWTEFSMKHDQLALWRYEPPLDIDNDGEPDDVLWYRDNRCDTTRPISIVLLVMNSKTLMVNEDKTRRLFAEHRPLPAGLTSFVPLRVGPMGLFQYSGTNYFYSWGTDLAGSTDDWLTNQKNTPMTSRVYVRKNNQATEVCEVRWRYRQADMHAK